MNRIEYQSRKDNLDYLRGNYDKLLGLSNDMLTTIHDELKSQGVKVSEINDNSFKIRYWGFVFIIKAETTYNTEREMFGYGELNTYLEKGTKEDRVLSYSFDMIGNINNDYVLNVFAGYYYLDFVSGLLKYIEQEKIKLPLVSKAEFPNNNLKPI